jgi:hypothetical protein
MVCVCAGAEMVELGCIEILVGEYDPLAFVVAAASWLDELYCAIHVGSCMKRHTRSTCNQNDDFEIDVYMMMVTNVADSGSMFRGKSSQEIQTLLNKQYFVLNIIPGQLAMPCIILVGDLRKALLKRVLDYTSLMHFDQGFAA